MRIIYGFRTVKAFRILIPKGMVNDYWIVCIFGIVSVFGMLYDYMIVKAFRIFIGKEVVNDYWIECVFGMNSAFGM